MMSERLVLGIKVHDHFSDFARGISGLVRDFPEVMLPLPPEASFNYVETSVMHGHDNHVHVIVMPSAALMAIVASAASRIKGMDGSSIVRRKLPHEDDGA